MQSPYPNRQSIRLQKYDYSQPGSYFITICTEVRITLFGEIVNGKMILNDAGGMVEKWKNDKLNGGAGNVVMETYTPYNDEPWMI